MREPIPVFSPVDQSGSKQENTEYTLPLRARLDQILETEISPENVNTYLEDALSRVVALAQGAVTQYRTEHPQTTLTGKGLEDAAFREFNLKAIDEVLPLIQKKKDEMDEIRGWLETHIQYVPGVIVPPEGPGPRAPGGGGGLEEPDVKNRLQTLLYILKTDGLDLESVVLTEGGLREDMWRRESYVDVSVPSLKRIVLVCDEQGNASYFFDTDKLDEVAHQGGNPLVRTMTKVQLRELIKQFPGVGYPLVYTHKWTENVRALLYEPIPVKDEIKPPVADGERRVSTSELDAWHGFWTDQGSGWHYSIPRTLAVKLSETFPKITKLGVEKLIKGHPIESRVVVGRGIDPGSIGYAYEDIVTKCKKTLARPHTAPKDSPKTGDWKHFAKVGNTHYGPESAIYRRLGIYRQSKMSSKINWAIVRSIEIQDIQGRPRTGLAYEDIEEQPDIKAFLEVPPVETQGKWKGFRFFEDVKKHYGGRYTIRLKIRADFGFMIGAANNSTLEGALEVVSSAVRKVRYHGEVVDSYPYEDIVASMKEYLIIKRDSLAHGGLFLRSSERGDGQWGNLWAIARHLRVKGTALHQRIRTHIKRGGKLESSKIGKHTAYRVSDIEPIAEGLERLSEESEEDTGNG